MKGKILEAPSSSWIPRAPAAGSRLSRAKQGKSGPGRCRRPRPLPQARGATARGSAAAATERAGRGSGGVCRHGLVYWPGSCAGRHGLVCRPARARVLAGPVCRPARARVPASCTGRARVLAGLVCRSAWARVLARVPAASLHGLVCRPAEEGDERGAGEQALRGGVGGGRVEVWAGGWAIDHLLPPAQRRRPGARRAGPDGGAARGGGWAGVRAAQWRASTRSASPGSP